LDLLFETENLPTAASSFIVEGIIFSPSHVNE